MLTLRNYQRAAIDALYEYLAREDGRPLVVLPTGSGKSLVMAEIVRDAVTRWPETRILILAHVKELLEQNLREILEHYPAANIGAYSAGLGKRETSNQIIVAGIQSVHSRACRLRAFDLILVDECFVGETKILTPMGIRRIDNMRSGDTVYCASGIGTVRAISCGQANALIRVRFSDGTEITCTPNHRIFTSRGWVAAAFLEGGEIAFGTQELRSLWERISTMAKSRCSREIAGSWRADVEHPSHLLNEMCEPIQSRKTNSSSSTEEGKTTHNAKSKTNSLVKRSIARGKEELRPLREGIPSLEEDASGRDRIRFPRSGMEQAALLLAILCQEIEESDEQSSGSPKNESSTARDKAQAYQAWRQRAVAAFAAISSPTYIGRRLGIGSYRSHKERSKNDRLSTIIQDRHCQPKDDDRNRNRRGFSPHDRETRAGRKEDRLLGTVRVVDVQSIECSRSRTVFNLHVSGHPSYFANGKLVHNCHLIPRASDTMYARFLRDSRTINPHVRVIGLTATDYRLDSGRLTESNHKGEKTFDAVVYDANVGDLIREGYLCGLRTVRTETRLDTSGVHTRGGEFVPGELERVVDVDEVTQAAVGEIVARGADRRAWLVFCSGVSHADHVAEALRAHGIAAGTITGETPAGERKKLVEDFRAGRLRALTNCNVLTTGFNVPHVDLLAILRPTQSTGLYVQMVGRGSRNADGKVDCLVLDFAGNIERHGPIDAVDVRTPTQGGGGEPPVKACPQCQTYCATAVRACPVCGFEFPEPEPKIHPTATDAPILSSEPVPPEWVDVRYVSYHEHQKEGKPPSLRVTYYCGLNRVSEWVCLEHGGFAGSKAATWWTRRAPGDPPPATVADALRRTDDLIEPVAILIGREGKYTRVAGYRFPAPAVPAPTADAELPF